MKAKITSPCMSMLFYEAARSPGQAEGCIYGEKAVETTQQITDSSVSTMKENILSIHALGAMQSLDTSANKQEGSLTPVGWYKICRRPSLHLTVREKSIHRKLAKRIMENGGCPSSVLTVLLHELWVEQQSAYVWRCAAFALNEDQKFAPVQMEIVNLKATNCGAYKPYPSIHQQRKLPEVNAALANLEASFTSAPETTSFRIVDAARQASGEVVKALDSCAGSLRETELLLERAHAEKRKLEQRRQELLDRKALAERVETETSCLDESSESCDTDVSCDMEKATTTADLGRDAEGGQFRPAQTFQGPENSSDANGHCVLPSEGRPVPDGQARRTEPPVSKDPFDNLVSIAKADLKKSGGGGKKTPVENAESGKVSVQGETPCVNGNAPSRELDAEGVARYNDDVPWAERTRAGRVKNVAD